MSRAKVESPAPPPGEPTCAPDYYHPPNYTPVEFDPAMTLAEEKLRFLQDEERRNRTRAALVEEELAMRQQKVKSLTAQQDERRALLRALDEEILKKQQLVNKLAVEAEDKVNKMRPLQEQFETRKTAVDSLELRREEMKRQLRVLEEEMTAKKRAVSTLGEQSVEVLEKQKVISDLLLQQRRLQEELERQRWHLDERAARTASTETKNEVMALSVDRQQIQLRMLEEEFRQRRQAHDTLQALVEQAEKQLDAARDKAAFIERETSKRRTEMQLLEEEVALKKQLLQELLRQHAKAQADISHEKRKLRTYQDMDELQRENEELKQQLTLAKQELARAQVSLEDQAYKAHSCEALMHAQRQRHEAMPLVTGSPVAVASNADQRQHLVTLLRRQEDRITRQQHDLSDTEASLKRAEAHLLQERELREMVENELSVALAELQMEKGKVVALQRTCDVQTIRMSALEGELEKIRQAELLLLLEGEPQTVLEPPAEDAPEPVDIPDVTDSIRRQQELIAQIQATQPQGRRDE